MEDLMGTLGKCIGKIKESFLLSSQEEMLGMLEQKESEGILIINKDSVDFTHGGIDKRHVLRINKELDTFFISDEKARFWVMCCVKFDGIAAVIIGSIDKAYEFAKLAATDPDLDELRVKIRIVGNGCIEIEHPLYTPSLCGLTVKVDVLSTDKQTLDF
ncbi:hypothetical protein T492DRAFT_850271 [Pavlovales sp. CCMP2436]|nr:hypothetical protein T492DRAFT_850271 [Pavlovales sp. CCMP2436]